MRYGTAIVSDVDNDDLHWLAGLMEGEGSFMKGPPSSPNMPILTLPMTDEDVVARVAALFGLRYQTTRRGAERGWKPAHRVTLKGRRAVEAMIELKPLMGHRRQEQIDVAIASWKPIPGKVSIEQGARIVKAFRAGVGVDALAAQYGISRWSVYAMHQGRYFGPRH
jgi:hypothetical protein